MKSKRSPFANLPSSWLGRNTRLLGLAAKIARKLASGSFQQLLNKSGEKGLAAVLDLTTQEGLADDLTAALGAMKGLAMKAGQVMSYVDFALPEKAREILGALQDSVVPMPPDVVEDIIKRELGRTPSSLFSEWSPVPIAAASIGQVHLAKLQDGTPLAIKIQYPEIEKTIQIDLGNLKIFDVLGYGIFRHQDKGAVLEEFKERLLEECNYEFEAKNQEKFKQLYQENSQVIIPDIFHEFSTKRVLTSRYYPAKRFKEFLSSSSQEQRNRAGEIIWSFAFESIFKHGLFNADPHPGNYLFTDNGEVVFLDFGCVKSFDREFISDWKEMAVATLEGDQQKLKALLIKKRISPRPNLYDFEYHYHMMRELYLPWREDKTFCFTHEFVAKTIQDLVIKNPNKFTTNMPRDWVFVNRLQWGLYSVLAMLNAQSNWHRRLMPLIQT